MKALTVGGAMIDTIAIIASDRIERMSMLNADSSFLLLEEGSKIEALEISTHVGGGAVNAAVTMARLGLDVASLVKLGKDARAEMVMARLLEEGVSSRWAMRDGRAPTGASVLVSSHDRNAAIFTFRGANTLLAEADLRKEAFAADLVYISSLSNESADAFPAIVEQRQGAGCVGGDEPARAPAVLARRRFSGFASPDRHPGRQPHRGRRAGAGTRRPLRRRRQGADPEARRAASQRLPCAALPAVVTR